MVLSRTVNLTIAAGDRPRHRRCGGLWLDRLHVRVDWRDGLQYLESLCRRDRLRRCACGLPRAYRGTVLARLVTRRQGERDGSPAVSSDRDSETYKPWNAACISRCD
jgi:hypothetical protein